MSRLLGLAPVLDENTRLLVLGSFPGVASLRAQQYYGHPQNHFWKILGALWQQPLTEMPYPERVAALRAHGLGLWDVYQACEREGSLDADIRAAELNDFAASAPRRHRPKLRRSDARWPTRLQLAVAVRSA